MNYRFSLACTIILIWWICAFHPLLLPCTEARYLSVVEKNITGTTKEGYIKSYSFPRRGSRPLLYRLVSLSSWGYIEIRTVDIFIHSRARLLIYDCACEEDSKKIELKKRSYFVSTGSAVTIKYEPKNINLSHAGSVFKLHYKFTLTHPTEMVMMNESVCGPYNLLKGYSPISSYIPSRVYSTVTGHVNVPQSTIWPGNSILVDCAWSFATSESSSIYAYLKILKDLDCSGLELEVRGDWHSEGELLKKGTPSRVRMYMPQPGWSKRNGVFIRLTGRITKFCGLGNKLSFAYTGMRKTYGSLYIRRLYCDSSFPKGYFACNDYCIPKHLKCDGYDHCGNQKDETPSACSVTTTTARRCPWSYYECSDGSCEYFLSECPENKKKCQSWQYECNDGTCQSTYSSCPEYDYSSSSGDSDNSWLAWAIGVPVAFIAILIIMCKQCNKKSGPSTTFSTQMNPISAGPAATTETGYMRPTPDSTTNHLMSDYRNSPRNSPRPSPFITPSGSPHYTPRQSRHFTDIPDPHAPPAYNSLEPETTPSAPSAPPLYDYYADNLQPEEPTSTPGFRDDSPMPLSALTPGDGFEPPSLTAPPGDTPGDSPLPPPPSYDDVVHAGSSYSISAVGTETPSDV